MVSTFECMVSSICEDDMDYVYSEDLHLLKSFRADYLEPVTAETPFWTRVYTEVNRRVLAWVDMKIEELERAKPTQEIVYDARLS